MQARGFLIDMDGVIYRGKQTIPGAIEFVNQLLERQTPFLFLTNNSRPTARDMVLKLEKLGLHVTEDHVFTSSMATAQFIAQQKPSGSAFVLGEGGLLKSLFDEGYAICDSEPDYVVVGEGRTLNLEMIEKAIDFILEGAKLIATNLDPAPKIKGWVKPGTGAIVAMLEEATGIKALSLGKPSPYLMRAARKRLQLASSETCIIGDTMETDILAGEMMGYGTILTLTGATSRESLGSYAFSPRLVVDSIADLLPMIKDGSLLLEGTGDQAKSPRKSKVNKKSSSTDQPEKPVAIGASL